MNKRACATAAVAIFIIGVVAAPASAHFTMGTHIPYYPFRQNHFDWHIQGLVGYVFPGGGLFTAGAPGWYTGGATYPGYQSPWPWVSQRSPTGVNNPFPSQGPTGWYQLDANSYAPFGAMLTSTIKAGTPFTTMWKANRWASDNPTIESLEIEHAVKGDFILAFNVTASQKVAWRTAHGNWFAVNFTLAEIMIPPEFNGLAANKIVASFTNNYDCIVIETMDREDFAYGPYWKRLRVYTDTHAFGKDQATYDKMDDAPDSWLKQTNKPVGPFEFTPWKTFGNITFNIMNDTSNNLADEWYYIRLNDVTAPTIAGAYHFKFRRLCSPELGDVFFPYQNWPVVLVKGEIDPAIITGTIRYGGSNTTVYGQPVTLPGRVRAVGIADDPYNPVKSTGRPVEARGYFDADWGGHYEIEGVAPGVYDIYASAAGYPEIKIVSNVKILRGQSYHTDGYLIPGVQVKGTVFSKCGAGEVPFPSREVGPERNIKIEIYRSVDDARSMLPGGSTSKAVTWSPFDSGNKAWGPWGFAWKVGGFSETNPRVPGGVGPDQSWQVAADATSFTFQFGREGYYGAPADMDGHVPGLGWSANNRNGATWVSGIGAGTYWVRAWLYGYVQTEPDGVTFMPVTFAVPSAEWPGNIYLPFDLRRSSVVEKMVHFHDVPGTLVESQIGWGWSYKAIDGSGGAYYRYLAAELVAPGNSNYKNQADESVFAWKIHAVPVASTNQLMRIEGFREMGLWYGYGRNHGIPAGLYTAKAYMWGYVEQVFEKVNLGLCGTATSISDHMYRGAKFNITVYSRDWQHPTTDKSWSFPYQPIYLQIVKDGKHIAPSWDYYVMPMTMQGYKNASVALFPYMWNNPFHMMRTHDGVARPFGTDNYRAIYGPSTTYYNDYFGPIPTGSLYQFRYYDGSENREYYYGLTSADGEGRTVGHYPFSFESGLYEFKALTYGYVQKKPVMVGATKGNATSDILITLTQGVEFRITMKFKHQGIFEANGIPFDAHLRFRVLDDKNRLVAEYLTSDWWWQPQFEAWSPANTTSYNWTLAGTSPMRPNIDFDPAAQVARSYWRLNYLPQGTKTVRVVIAGLPDLYGWVSGYPCDPCGTTGDSGWADRPIDAPYGIDGYPNYKGGWKLQVHVVPIFDYYPGHYYNRIEVSGNPTRPGFVFTTAPTNPVGFEGMLTGELTYTADMKTVLINHLGPYELRYDVVVPGAHLGGESSLIFQLDRIGFVSGTVVGYTWCDDWRTISWVPVRFIAADGSTFTSYTRDGRFAEWLKPGPYTAQVAFWTPAKGEGYRVQTIPYHVSDGSIGDFQIYLEQSSLPIPEFQATALMLASALATSLIILRRRKKQ